MLQPLELLAVVAGWTSDIILGTSILVAGYHRPVDLAQRITTLDVLSGGRTVFGFSVGWSDEEHAQYDVDPRTRGRRAGELIDAMKACWGPDPVSYDGEFFTIPVADVDPKPRAAPAPAADVGHALGGRPEADRRAVRLVEPGLGHARAAPGDDGAAGCHASGRARRR